MTTKKKLLTEIGVFLLITFGLMFTFAWVPYDDTGEVKTGLEMLSYYLAAFSPAIGCIATRYIFHEGFRDDILFPKFTGHFKVYFLAVILPILFGILNCIFITIVLGAGFTIKAEGGVLEIIAAISLYSIGTYTAAFILIGEELGWRAFLYDKLEKLTGFHGSIIIGGIIWGLWHTPPLITIGLIAHAVIDTICNPLASIFLSEEIVDGKKFQMGLCMIVSSLILGIPCWIYMARHSARHREESVTKEG